MPPRHFSNPANARAAALQRSATEDTRDMTAAASAAFQASFAPSDPELDEAERERRRRAGLRAHMIRLSQLAAAKRSGA